MRFTRSFEKEEQKIESEETMEENNKKNILFDQDEDRGIATEELKEYIRVGSAGGFILIGALIIAIVSLLIWGFTGSIPVTYTNTGIICQMNSETNSCICFVNVDANTGVISKGRKANIIMQDGRSFPAVMDYFSQTPYSAEELRKMFSSGSSDNSSGIAFSDWMMEKALDGCDYAYLMTVTTQTDISVYWHQVAQAMVVIDEISPISFLVQ